MIYSPFSGKWESVITIGGDQLKYDNEGQIKPMVFQNFAKPITMDKNAPAAPVKKTNTVAKTALKKF